MRRSTKLYAGAAILLPAAIALAPSAARATPYAFANNQITGLTITFADGTPLTGVSSDTTNISDTATFGTSAPASFDAGGVVGNALPINQAFSGTSAAPPASLTALGPGAFTGTRGDASITAGSASSGGVGVSNVAEGFGSAIGNSVGNNSAAINFTVTGTGKAVLLTFNDAFGLTASTAALSQETATASITNTFRVTDSSGTAILDVTPAQVNPAELTSQAGLVPNPVTGSVTGLMLTTPVLTSGVTYNLSLFSSASEDIGPGTATPVPEPATLGLLGAGLLGFGFVSRRKRG